MGNKVENRSPSPNLDGYWDETSEKISDGLDLVTCTDYINDARENYFNLGYAFARENDRFESFRWMKWKRWNLILQLTTLTHVITAFFERTIIMDELRLVFKYKNHKISVGPVKLPLGIKNRRKRSWR